MNAQTLSFADVEAAGLSDWRLLFEALRTTFPHAAAIMNLYGLSETSGTVVMSPWGADFDVVSRSIGRALDGVELEIRDDAGKAVPTGETGEIWVRSDAVVPFRRAARMASRLAVRQPRSTSGMISAGLKTPKAATTTSPGTWPMQPAREQ